MQSQKEETSEEVGSNKRGLSSKSSSPAKRVHLDKQEASEEQHNDVKEVKEEMIREEEEEKVVTEEDVGISAYVNDSLVPINGGIIKHRFSDFHVREVSLDGTVCHITSLYPPTKEQRGSGLYEFMKQQEAEMVDETGNLLKERREKQAAEKAEKEQAKQMEAEREWIWEVNQSREAELLELLGDEALEKVKRLWEEGPLGYKSQTDETNSKEREVDSNESVPLPIDEVSNEASSRDNRGERGGRSRGGRGGGRAGEGRREADPRVVMSRILASKEERTAVHQLVRETFQGNLITDTLETPSIEDETIKISKIRIRWISKEPGRMRFDRREGQRGDEPPPYIHFLLQKTNRESQDALNIVAKSLGLLHPGAGTSKALRDLSVAGTKDKRAVTVQKVAFKRGRKEIEDVWKLLNGVGKPSDSGGRGGRGGRGGQRGGSRNGGGKVKSALDAIRSRGDRGIRVGHLEYAQEPLHLGMLQGNEFIIVLRDVQVESRSTVDKAINVLREKGFINYYGMQRFGTSIVSTHTVGIALFRNDFHEAVSLIMAPRPGDSDEVQEARQAFLDGDVEKCLKLMPHYNIPERSILQRMQADKEGQKDWKGYFMAIPRGLRTMYVHAYQSYIWNRMVTERVRRFALDGPVIGDLVYAGDTNGKETIAEEIKDNADEDEQLDGQGKGVQPKRVKELANEEDVRQYSIHDIVMPLPGNEIQMSDKGWMAQVYREMLAEDKLTPDDIGNSNVPEFALKGDYRKVLHLPRNVSYQLLRYHHVNANLCQSDEDEVLGIDAPNATEYTEDGEPLDEGESIAMLLRLTLGVSAYATMALREVLKQDTSVAHQKELTEKSDRQKARSPVYRNQAVNKIQGKQVRTWGAAPKLESTAQEVEAGEKSEAQIKE